MDGAGRRRAAAGAGLVLATLGADGVRAAELLPARIEGFRPRLDPVQAARVLRRLAA